MTSIVEKYLLTIEDYHKMAEVGILDTRKAQYIDFAILVDNIFVDTT